MFRKLALFSVLIALTVSIFGAYLRHSNSGLGCPDWPGCYGQWWVPQGSEAEAQAARDYPAYPLDQAKAWRVMSHRYLAGALGLSVLGLWFMAWFQKGRRLRLLTWSTVLLGLVALQVALGMWTVQLALRPVAVSAHFLLGMAVLALLFRLYLLAGPATQTLPGRRGIKTLIGLGLAVLLLQFATGTWTSSNYAALACPDFPTCLGQWWPSFDYAEPFRFWKELGSDASGRAMSGQTLAAIHWVHRVAAVVTFVVLASLVFVLSSGRYGRALSRTGLVISLLLLVQVGLGIGVVLMRLPPALALAHHAVAAGLLLALIYAGYYSARVGAQRTVTRTEPLPIPQPPVPAAVSVPVEVLPQEEAPENLFLRLKNQLSRTRGGLSGVFAGLPLGGQKLDEAFFEQVEENLLMADVGMDATRDVVEHLTTSLKNGGEADSQRMGGIVRDKLFDMLAPCSQPLVIRDEQRPFVILVVGVNGAGKTTTIGKLAKRLQVQGHSVMLAAGDTFRAAAIEQLQAWGERNSIAVVAQHSGADSASVIFDALQSAQAKGVDVLIADTAGRLHTKSNLMEELSKIKRILAKLDASAPHEVLLVLDAGTGQNAISQARQFNEAVGLTGIALTKLDGTAKGGVIFSLANQFGIPIRFIGIGEKIDDLQDFDARRFIDAIFPEETAA